MAKIILSFFYTSNDTREQVFCLVQTYRNVWRSLFFLSKNSRDYLLRALAFHLPSEMGELKRILPKDI